MTPEEWQEYYRDIENWREIDIFISQYLFNKPCVKWWWTDNYDGEETIAKLKNTWHEEEEQKEPLYELVEGDFYFREFSEEDKKKPYLFDEDSFDGKYHRCNLKIIPNYSRDLNLIHRCEKKLEEMNLQIQYYWNLHELFFPHIGISEMLSSNFFSIVNANAQTKAKAIVQTLKEHFNVK